MRVSPVSFKNYTEDITVLKSVDPRVLISLKNARPYLRQIGNSMPYPRDLYITVRDDGCDTILSAYDYNKKNKKLKLMAMVTEHKMTEHGLDFVNKVFEGLKKNCSSGEFKNIAAEFVTRFNKIQNEQYPLRFVQCESDRV